MIQFLWIHTDKICLPTIILWLIFVWMEAKIRWKDNRNIPHLDLCRPFAAHCIGYPVVTLGFGFKSYIGYRIRQRKQREVAKENEFYMQLLQQALPQDVIEKSEEQAENITENSVAITPSTTTTTPAISNSNCKNTHNHHNHHSHQNKTNANGSIDGHHHNSSSSSHNHNHHISSNNNSSSSHLNGGVNTNSNSTSTTTTSNKQHNNMNKKNAEKENGCIQHIENNHQQEIIPNNAILSSSKPSSNKASNHLNFNNLQSVKNTNTTSYQQIQNGITKELNVPAKCSPYKNNKDDHNTYVASSNKKEYEKEKIIKDTHYEDTTITTNEPTSQKRKDKQQKDNHQQQYHQTNASHINNNNVNNNSNSNCNNNNHLNNNSHEKNKACEQCQRNDQDAKRLKSELHTIKSLEQELRQKYENVKGCLQAKQKENEEIQKQ